MSNPWMKKNPFMSMWLSGANSVIGSARGHAAAQAKRNLRSASSNAISSGMEQATDLWTKALFAPPTKRKRRRTR